MLKINKLVFTNDHAAIEMKNKLLEHFKDKYEVIDYGINQDISVDYPDYAASIVTDVLNNNGSTLGIAICGTGIGMSISLNKFKGIRCANITDPRIAQLAKEHNNCNAIALSARFIDVDTNIQIINNFLNSNYDSRHDKRLNKIILIENKF